MEERRHLRLFFCFFFLFSFLEPANGIPEEELEALISALRFNSHHLFANAILTSDLRLHIVSGSLFSIFAPTDYEFFAVDMITTAATYTRTLLGHVSPVRLTLEDLQSLRTGSVIPTLLPTHGLRISGPDGRLSVNGVHISAPGIFYSSSVVIHGLNGILNVSHHEIQSPESVISSGPSPDVQDPAITPDYGRSWTSFAPDVPSEAPGSFPIELPNTFPIQSPNYFLVPSPTRGLVTLKSPASPPVEIRSQENEKARQDDDVELNHRGYSRGGPHRRHSMTRTTSYERFL